MASDADAAWAPTTISGCYGAQQRTVEVLSGTAIWYSTSLPAVPLRWVLIRDPEEKFETQALLCTELEATPERIISWFVRRLADGGHFPGGTSTPRGFETQRQCSDGAIRRSAPELLALFSLLTLFAP